MKEEVEHFDLDLTHKGGNGGGHPKGDGENKGGGNKGGGKHNSFEISEECLNYVDSD